MEEYNQLYEELVKISKEILPYYDVDKVKFDSVYIWTKYDEFGRNVFDIISDDIYIYNKEHKIIEESIPIINKIQCKLKEIENYLDN